MIADVQRGRFMPALISYLFGPGKHNEHVDQHLIAGYDDAVFSAADRLWQSEPGKTRQVATEARELGWQVEYPHLRWHADIPKGHVWHCSLSIKAEEGQLSDTQWTAAAHAVVEAMGFSASSGKAPCRWVAVRHGLSREGNDHVHLAVNLVREDGTKATTWNDYRTVGRVCAELEDRFGLEHVTGRMTGRSVPEPTRADREISAKRGEAEPLRIRLERLVRACAAAAWGEAEFVGLARANGLLIRPRHADGDGTRIVGYAVAEGGGRTAFSARTGRRGPVWFGGGKLATDLALPRLRERWEGRDTDIPAARLSALAAWSAAIPGALTPDLPGPHPAGKQAAQVNVANAYRHLRQLGSEASAHGGAPGDGEGTPPGPDLTFPAADALAAAAIACEAGTGGPLSQAARHMARAAQQHGGRAGRSQAAAAIRDVASAFVTTALAGVTDADFGALLLMTEVARLVDACAIAHASACDARRASALVHGSLPGLIAASGAQARSVLEASGALARSAVAQEGITMSEATHEDELLRHLTQAGLLGVQVTRAGIEAFSQPGNGRSSAVAAEAARLEAAGYRRETAYDGHLRSLLGEGRWAQYAGDPGRIICAAMIFDGAQAGHDMNRLLTTAVRERPWEDDPTSASRSIAHVLAYRVSRNLRTGKFISSADSANVAGDWRSADQQTLHPETGVRAPSKAAGTSAGTQARTPYDDRLRELLGDERWQKYARDPGRADVAGLIFQAEQQGRDVNAMLARVVSERAFEDDPRSPARRIAPILRHRIQAALASSESSQPETAAGSETITASHEPGSGPALPPDVAQALSQGKAPASNRPRPEGSSYGDTSPGASNQKRPPAARPPDLSRD